MLLRRTPDLRIDGRSLVESGARVMILGAYGMGNVGDEAILGGLLQRATARERLVVVSGAPAETEALHGVRAVGPSGALPALRDVDALLIGGGGLFSRHMGRFGRMIPLFGLSALAMGKPVTIEGVSVDRSLPPMAKPFLIQLARRAVRVAVRDQHSARVLRAWGIDAAVEPDLSTYLEPPGKEESMGTLASTGLDPTRPVVGLCLTAVEPNLDPVLEMMPAVIERLPGVQFCFVPMSRHRSVSRHNDVLPARRIQRRAPDLRILTGLHHPREVLGLFSHFSAAVCMRYHSMLFAQRMGVPVIGIPYAQKCESWMREHRLRTVPLTEDALVEAIRNHVESAKPSCGCVLRPLVNRS